MCPLCSSSAHYVSDCPLALQYPEFVQKKVQEDHSKFAWGPQSQSFQNYSQSQSFIGPYQNQTQPLIYPEVQPSVPITQSNLSCEDWILKLLEEIKGVTSHMRSIEIPPNPSLDDKVAQALRSLENTQGPLGLDQDLLNSSLQGSTSEPCPSNHNSACGNYPDFSWDQ